MVESLLVAATLHKKANPPLGVIGSLASGFEIVNARLELILLPLALDLFLWLGPHISVRPIVDQLLDQLGLSPAGDPMVAQGLETWRQLLTTYGTRFNLFSVLSTAPLGLPSLVAGRAAVNMPRGIPVTWSIQNPLQYVLLFGAFALIGLFLGAVYYGLVAQQVRDARLNLRRLVRQVWGDWARVTAFGVVAALVLLAIGSPVLLFAWIVSLLSPEVGLLISLLGTTLMLWAVFYLGFTLHGIILQRRGLFGALWDSLLLVHHNLPHTAGLYLAILLLSLGLGGLWNMPADDSWLLLVGLVGHALVSTALVAATFAFYQDRYRWWLELRQARRAQAQAGAGEANRGTKT